MTGSISNFIFLHTAKLWHDFITGEKTDQKEKKSKKVAFTAVCSFYIYNKLLLTTTPLHATYTLSFVASQSSLNIFLEWAGKYLL